jgi:hypothetical protein
MGEWPGGPEEEDDSGLFLGALSHAEEERGAAQYFIIITLQI